MTDITASHKTLDDEVRLSLQARALHVLEKGEV